MGKSLSDAAKQFSIDEERNEFFYNKKREIVDNDFKTVAKLSVVKKNGEEKATYYLRKFEDDLYDPYGIIDIKKTTMDLFPFKKVEKETFDLYFEYLKGRQNIYLTKARRQDITYRR
jgi:hypothetical protein